MTTEQIKEKVKEWLALSEPKDIIEFLKDFSKEDKNTFYTLLYYVQK